MFKQSEREIQEAEARKELQRKIGRIVSEQSTKATYGAWNTPRV